MRMWQLPFLIFALIYAKDEIRLPKVEQPHTTISPLNPSQMKTILHSFDTKTYLGMRNYTIIRLLKIDMSRLEDLTSNVCGIILRNEL